METAIQIDRMALADVPACVRILLDNPLWAKYGVTAEGAARMFSNAIDEGATILVARETSQAVGFVWVAPRGAWDRSGYIRLIGVSPQHQGKRIGERLMEAAEAAVGPRSGEMFLLVTDSNLGAQRFYRRLGYRQVGAIPDYVIPGVAELIFYKKLTPEGV